MRKKPWELKWKKLPKSLAQEPMLYKCENIMGCKMVTEVNEKSHKSFSGVLEKKWKWQCHLCYNGKVKRRKLWRTRKN